MIGNQLIDEYTAYHRKSISWVDEAIIQALTPVLEINLVVLAVKRDGTEDNSSRCFFKTQTTNSLWFILNINGIHFESFGLVGDGVKPHQSFATYVEKASELPLSSLDDKVNLRP